MTDDDFVVTTYRGYLREEFRIEQTAKGFVVSVTLPTSDSCANRQSFELHPLMMYNLVNWVKRLLPKVTA